MSLNIPPVHASVTQIQNPQNSQIQGATFSGVGRPGAWRTRLHDDATHAVCRPARTTNPTLLVSTGVQVEFTYCESSRGGGLRKGKGVLVPMGLGDVGAHGNQHRVT